MASRNFSEWLSTFKDSINEYGYYTDFDTVYRNVGLVEEEIEMLNSIVGSENIENDFKSLIMENKNVLAVIPLLLAVRDTKIYCQDENGGKTYNFVNPNLSVDEYCYFMQKTGLFDLLQNKIDSNLMDYIIGVEVGLGSNGRKNRGGHQMENLVESYIERTGLKHYKEMYLDEVEKMWNVDLSAISAEGTSTKRFDFVVKTANTIYLIETNFYTSGGSKLNETARSYKMIAEEVKDIDGVEFLWFTDGAGWKSAQKNLHETFDVLETIYNINDLENGILTKVFV